MSGCDDAAETRLAERSNRRRAELMALTEEQDDLLEEEATLPKKGATERKKAIEARLQWITLTRCFLCAPCDALRGVLSCLRSTPISSLLALLV
jgi:hypothetical protein